MLKSLSFYLCILVSTFSQAALATIDDIRLSTLQNEPDSLNRIISNGLHANKLTLVMVWATDCPPCEAQKPMIQQFHDDHSNDVATVVGIAIDGLKHIEEVNRLIEKNRPTYPNFLADPDTFLEDFEAVTGQAFDGAPSYILFNAKGHALAVAIGPVTKEQLQSAIAP